MRIALGSDHRGVELVRTLHDSLTNAGHEATIVGPACEDSCDYADSAYPVAKGVSDGTYDRGILICGSGIGMSIAANKVHGVRASLVFTPHQAEMTRRHNDSNVLCISADGIDAETAQTMTDTWVATDFDGGRHARRLEKVAAIERGEDPTRVKVKN